MAVNINVTDGTGDAGDVVVGWSVNESTTPSNPSRSPEGTGSISFGAKANDDSVFLVDDEVVFSHETLGSITGIVGDLTVNDINVNATISKKLALLDNEFTMPPTSTSTVSQVITNYVSTVTDQITVVYAGSNDPTILVPGWKDSVWKKINELCALYRLEIISTDGVTLLIRDKASTTIDIVDEANTSRSISSRASGLYIDVIYNQSVLSASDATFKWNYSQNPSLETNATGWAMNSTYNGTVTSGRVTN